MIDMPQVLYHGLSLDMSMSGYLTIIPLLLLIASIWWLRPDSLVKIFNAYFAVVLPIIAIATSVDLILYSHWGFHLDPAVLLYLQSPKEVIASGSTLEWFLGILVAIILLILFYWGYVLIIRKMILRLTVLRNRAKTCFILVLLAGVLFLPIRGGVTVSTMNISYAYFSDRMFLNHAAINPIFNFMYSLGKFDNFESQYQFYDRNEAVRSFERLHRQSENSTVPKLLHTSRPNIILCILESFSYDVAFDSIVAPNMYRFAKEGVLFNNFYANGFRTDRGLVSVMSGYPSHPTAAILKYPKKTDALPTIPKSLRKSGYDNQSVYYGGDVEFANMRSYFVGACGIQDIVSDKDFPVKERLTKWGVPDQPLLERVYQDLTETEQGGPFLKVILTLSSHEPFDVPTDIFDIPFLNSVNYTDECIGKFVSDLKSTNLWHNTLIVFIADHAMQSYPQGTNNYDKVRFHIPMIWLGGAVRKPAIISDYGSQNDLAATLLSQLQIDYSGFKFSKDLLDPQSRKFSFYSYVNGFCMMDSSSVFLYDNNQQRILEQTGDPDLEKEAKSFFQMMYLDLGSR
jgi:phosphoglycerol transferase MdoB-like AlkP superfamily enzyme